MQRYGLHTRTRPLEGTWLGFLKDDDGEFVLKTDADAEIASLRSIAVEAVGILQSIRARTRDTETRSVTAEWIEFHHGQAMSILTSALDAARRKP